VYDYVPGKVDWLARDLPVEGERAGDRRVGAFARADAATCALDARAADVLADIEASPYGFALVLADDGTLLGRLPRSAIEEGDADATAEALMSPGPSTVRPDSDVGELREKLEKRDLKTAIVSTPEGRPLGVVKRSALED
jgi:predicted transcriptional regulator